MPTLTNRLGLPSPIILARLAQLNAYHQPGDISVTGCEKPPRARILAEYHDAEIVEDAADNMYRSIGTAIHAQVQAACGRPEASTHAPRWVAAPGVDTTLRGPIEARLSVRVRGWDVTGAPDYYDREAGIIWDWKVTSVWEYVFGERGLKWAPQLNKYAHLLREHGETPRGLRALCVWRDWSKNQRGDSYPTAQVTILDLPLWPAEQAALLLESEVDSHQRAQQAFDLDGRLPLCTDEERWARWDKAQKRTVYPRCDYCSAQPFCRQAHAETLNPSLTELRGENP